MFASDTYYGFSGRLVFLFRVYSVAPKSPVLINGDYFLREHLKSCNQVFTTALFKMGAFYRKTNGKF